MQQLIPWQKAQKFKTKRTGLKGKSPRSMTNALMGEMGIERYDWSNIHKYN